MEAPNISRKDINVKSFLDIAGVIFVALDDRGRITLINQKGCDILGYPEDQIIGKDWFDHFIPDDTREQVRTAFGEILRSEIVVHEFYENPLLAKNGEIRIIHWHNALLRDATGRVTGTLSSGEDITERKLLEKKTDHLYRVLQAIRNVNQLITKEKNKARLIEESCQLLTETRGYVSAWIALFDGPNDLLMTSHSGLDMVFQAFSGLLESGRWPYCIQKTLESGTVTIIDRKKRECSDCPLLEMDPECYVMSTPIEYKGHFFGMLSVRVPGEIEIDEDEKSLLEEVTGDIAFALQSIESEEARQKAEEKLRQNEQFLQDIFDAIQDGISVLDKNYNVVRINRWMERMYAGEMPIVGKKCYRVYQKRSSPCSFCPLEITWETGQPQNEIVPYPSEKNPTGWIDLTVFPVKDDKGEIIHLIEYVKDISEQKRAEQALRESELRYRALFETAKDAIFLMDRNEFITCNKAAVKMFGCDKKNDIIGQPPWAYSPPVQPDGTDSRKQARRVIDAALKDEPQQFYWKHLRKNGTQFDAQVSLNKLVLGGKAYLQAIVRDVTEQNRARMALKESEAKYRSLIENSNDAIYLLYNKRFEIVNHKFKEMMGISIDEVQKPDFDLMSLVKPDDRNIIEQRIKDIQNGKNVAPQYQFTVVRPDGREVIVEASVSYIPYKEGLATQGILRNMTERIRSENQIRQSLREKEVLLQEVHHRVKNNLNVITSLLSLQAMQLKTKEQAVNAFKKSKDRIFAMAMVHEKLYQSGVYTEIDMKDYTKTLVRNLLQIYTPETAIQTVLELDRINMDINRAIPCGLILNELITNALKHAFKGKTAGKLTIIFRKNKAYELMVKDTGVGLKIGPGDKNADSLGMELVNILTDQLDGKLSIVSKNGTEFKIVFPVNESEKTAYR